MLGGGLTSRSHPANHPFSSLQPPTLHPTMKSLLAALLGLALLGAAVADEWEKPEWCKVGFGPPGLGLSNDGFAGALGVVQGPFGDPTQLLPPTLPAGQGLPSIQAGEWAPRPGVPSKVVWEGPRGGAGERGHGRLSGARGMLATQPTWVASQLRLSS